MDIGSILLILALVILVGIFVSRPLFERKSAAAGPDEPQLSALLAERDRIINALQELDFDSALGKIPEGDYPAQRAVLLQRGADILRQLDNLTPTPTPERLSVSPPSPAGGGGESVEDRLEAAIAARRAQLPSPPGRAPVKNTAAGGEGDDALEAQIAARRRARQEKSGGFCPKCGKPVQLSDRFCPKCGHSLT